MNLENDARTGTPRPASPLPDTLLAGSQPAQSAHPNVSHLEAEIDYLQVGMINTTMAIISHQEKLAEQQQARMQLLLSRLQATFSSTGNGEGDRTISAEFPTQTLILEQETSASQVTAPLGVILPDDASDISLPEEIMTPNAEQPRADTAPEIANVQEKHMVNETMQQDLDIRTAALSHTTFPKAGTGEAPGCRSTHEQLLHRTATGREIEEDDVTSPAVGQEKPLYLSRS